MSNHPVDRRIKGPVHIGINPGGQINLTAVDADDNEVRLAIPRETAGQMALDVLNIVVGGRR